MLLTFDRRSLRLLVDDDLWLGLGLRVLKVHRRLLDLLINVHESLLAVAWRIEAVDRL